MSPAAIFALALFGAVGVSHAVRPSGWKAYVTMLAESGAGGVLHYSVLHALPGAMLLALATTGGWSEMVLIVVGTMLIVKAAMYGLFPEFGLRRIRSGLALPMWCWSAAGALWMAVAFTGMVPWIMSGTRGASL